MTDDIVYGGVGVQPAVLQQCENHQSHQPKFIRTTSSTSGMIYNKHVLSNWFLNDLPLIWWLIIFLGVMVTNYFINPEMRVISLVYFFWILEWRVKKLKDIC